MNETNLYDLNIVNFSETDYNDACKMITENYNGAQCCGIANIRINNEIKFEVYQYSFNTKTATKLDINDSYVLKGLSEYEYIKYLILHNVSEDTYCVLYNTKINVVSDNIVAPFDIFFKCETLHKACVIIDSNAIENSLNENMEIMKLGEEIETEYNDIEEFEKDEVEEGTTPYDACDEITEGWDS